MEQPTPLGASRASRSNAIYPFEFTGSGGEYFRIWIVNLLLTVLTLGIYSAWAKVRRLRYFYGSTQLAGSSFEYHGEPLKILKGRLIAIAFIVPYTIASQFAPVLALLFLLVFLVALPFIVVKSRLFQMRMSSWRNIRFDFAGTYKEAALVYIGLAILIPFTLGLIIPYIMYARHRFLIGKAKYGTSDVEFGATPGVYYIAHLIGLGVMLGGVLLLGALAALLIGSQAQEAAGDPLAILGFMWQFLFLILIAVALWTYAYAVVQARTTNAAYGELRIGGHDIKCEIGAGQLAGIYLSNTVLTAITLGLFSPWAKVRLARYQLSCMSLEVIGSLDDFIANESKQVEATGSEVGDLLDLDFGL